MQQTWGWLAVMALLMGVAAWLVTVLWRQRRKEALPRVDYVPTRMAFADTDALWPRTMPSEMGALDDQDDDLIYTDTPAARGQRSGNPSVPSAFRPFDGHIEPHVETLPHVRPPLGDSALGGGDAARDAMRAQLTALTDTHIGPYVILRQLGQGAMGAVYLCGHPDTGDEVAIKTMALADEFHGAELAEARTRFIREAEMAGHLHHPDIVHIRDAGEAGGVAYIVMDLVHGQDLTQFTAPDRLLPVADVLHIVARVAEALAHAHSRGVTHRDIKPANIMVDLAANAVKVMDFGVARMDNASRTRTGIVLGTPTFMSPEQLSGLPVDGRSDLYSLGVTLFQLLTGQLPYPNGSLAVLMRAIGQEPPPPLSSLRPDLPQALGDILALCLQKHPATRYANGLQLAEDLRAVEARLPRAMPGESPSANGH
jgi:serine/threonine protein kinase